MPHVYVPPRTTNVPLVSPFASEGLLQFSLDDYPEIIRLIEEVEAHLARRDVRSSVERLLCLYLCLPRDQKVVLKDWSFGEDGKLKVVSIMEHDTSKPFYRYMKVVACHLLGHFGEYWNEIIWAHEQEMQGEMIEPLMDIPLEADYLRDYADLIGTESLDITEEQ
jgi:hypothetical protein